MTEVLLRDEALGVVERVPYGEPVTWCHRMVVTRKHDGSPAELLTCHLLTNSAGAKPSPLSHLFTLHVASPRTHGRQPRMLGTVTTASLYEPQIVIWLPSSRPLVAGVTPEHCKVSCPRGIAITVVLMPFLQILSARNAALTRLSTTTQIWNNIGGGQWISLHALASQASC